MTEGINVTITTIRTAAVHIQPLDWSKDNAVAFRPYMFLKSYMRELTAIHNPHTGRFEVEYYMVSNDKVIRHTEWVDADDPVVLVEIDKE